MVIKKTSIIEACETDLIKMKIDEFVKQLSELNNEKIPILKN